MSVNMGVKMCTSLCLFADANSCVHMCIDLHVSACVYVMCMCMRKSYGYTLILHMTVLSIQYN